MKRLNVKTTRIAGWAVGCLAAILIYIFVCAVSWIITCGLVKLITLCFGFEYTWGIATGIWLIICLLKHIFSSGNNKRRD